jgi:hypothetical protein
MLLCDGSDRLCTDRWHLWLKMQSNAMPWLLSYQTSLQITFKISWPASRDIQHIAGREHKNIRSFGTVCSLFVVHILVQSTLKTEVTSSRERFRPAYQTARCHNPEDHNKSKVIPATGCGGTSDCETSRLPHFLDNRLTDGGDVSLTRRPSYTPPDDSWYSFLLETDSTPGL